MAYSTYAAFVTAVAQQSVTGVAKALTCPPSQVDTGRLPLSYPRLPEMQREIVSLGGSAGLDSGTMEMVFLISPTAQGLNATNFAKMTALVDAIDTAMAANEDDTGVFNWSIRQETAAVGDTPFWALVVTVEGGG